MSGDLATWLRARLDEDERKVAAMEREEKRVQTAPIFGSHPPGWLAGVDIFVSSARWRAEIDAKRRILELHAPEASTNWVNGEYVPGEPTGLQCVHCARLCHSTSGLSCESPDAPWPCPTVLLLALPYADRPGYLEEWRPADAERR